MRWLIWLLVLVAGCGSATSVGGVFTLDEFTVDGPHMVSEGTTSLEISNAGDFNHTLVITDADGNALAATEVVAHGSDTALSIELLPGSYQVSCRLVGKDPEGNIIDHYELGMFSQLKIEG
jgi:hypothetical protein